MGALLGRPEKARKAFKTTPGTLFDAWGSRGAGSRGLLGYPKRPPPGALGLRTQGGRLTGPSGEMRFIYIGEDPSQILR